MPTYSKHGMIHENASSIEEWMTILGPDVRSRTNSIIYRYITGLWSKQSSPRDIPKMAYGKFTYDYEKDTVIFSTLDKTLVVNFDFHGETVFESKEEIDWSSVVKQTKDDIKIPTLLALISKVLIEVKHYKDHGSVKIQNWKIAIDDIPVNTVYQRVANIVVKTMLQILDDYYSNAGYRI